MITEALIKAELDSLVSTNVFPDVAPAGAATPRIVYQQAGGKSNVYLEGSLPSRRNARMQIAVWSKTRKEAVELAEQVEARMVAAMAFAAEPLGAYTALFETDTGLYGTRQDFSVWSTR